MGQLGQFLSEMYQQRVEQDKQRARKFKALVEYADTSGIMPKDRAVVMDVDSLEGAVQGHAARLKFKEAASAMQKFANEEADRAALTSFARDFATGDAAALGRMVTPDNTAPIGEAFNGMANPENLKAFGESFQPANRLNFALGRNPAALAAPQFDNSVAGLARFSGVGAEDLTPGSYTVPETGAMFAYRGKQFLPAGFKPGSSGAGGLKELTSPGGKLLGFVHTDIRGKETFIKPPPGVELSQAKDETGSALPGIFVDSAGKPHDYRDQYQKFGIDKPSPTEEEQSGFWTRVFGGKGEKAAPGKAAKEKKAVGGYEIGRVYGGLKYLGGDPHREANWERVR